MTNTELYFLIGVIVTNIMIFNYRNDGQSRQKYELYFAAVAFLIWPLQLIKFGWDILKKL